MNIKIPFTGIAISCFVLSIIVTNCVISRNVSPEQVLAITTNLNVMLFFFALLKSNIKDGEGNV